IAAGDDSTRIAIPLTTVEAGRDAVTAVERLLAERPAGKIIVGLPVTLRGEIGPQARVVEEFVRKLSERVGLPVETRDERYTTSDAMQRLGPGHKPQARDAAAAAIILQDYFDSLPRKDEA
ncbi:MAG TPA: Holliday junction resolvase RuvX, partial [Dehalococcoidia bacterium]|nr:Holliday junction resolvase RuvX [Dehalococcoidia bacterium]